MPTINGRIVPQNREEDPSFLSTFNRFEDIQRKIQRVVESGRCSKRFQIRLCNIRDPVDASNNLGVSVTAQSLHYLNLALVNGSKHLETLLHNSIGTSHHPQENFFFLQDFFPRSCEALLSETQVRSDIKDHPLQLYDAIEASALRAACYPSLLSLEGDLDAMWRNLKTACEICALNDVGCLGSHSITTPRSVETTKALPSLAAVPEEKTEKLVVDKRTTEDETASRSLEEEELRYKDMEGMKAGGDVILLQEKEEEMAQTLKEEEGSSGPLEEPPMGVDDAVASGIDASEQMTIALMGTSGEEPERESSEEKASTESLVSLKEIATSGESLKQFDYIESRLEFTENLLLATVSSNHQPRQQHMGRNQRRRKSKRKKEMIVEPHASPSSPVLTIETKASLEVSPEIDWAYEGGDPELDSSTSELSVLSTVTQLGENGHFSGNNSSSKLLGELLNIRRDSLSSGRTDVEESCLTRQDDYGDQQQHTEVDTLCVSYPALTTAAYPSTISSELVSSSSAQVPLVAKGAIVASSSGHFSLLNLPQLLSPENYHATSPGWSGSSVALRRRLYTATCLDAANGVSSGAQRVSEHQARDPKELSVTTAADTKKVEEEDAPLPQPLDWQRLLGGGLFVLFVVCMPIVLRSMLSLLRNDLPSSRNRGMQRYFANEPDKTNPFMSYSIPPRGPSSTALKNIENFQPLETITPSLHYVNIGDSVSFGLRRSDEEIEEEIFALTSYAFVGWWKNGVQVTGAPPRLSFTIQRVTLEDVGEYECFVRPYSRSSSVGSSGSGSGQQESLRLVARASLRLAEPPVVKMKFSYSELQVGQELKVAISVVEGTPAPSFQWFRNGVSLPGQREEKLYYPSVEPGHAGTYSCLVENMAGGVMWLEATVSVRPPLQHSSSHAHHPR